MMPHQYLRHLNDALEPVTAITANKGIQVANISHRAKSFQ
jgi:hypothetical protein